LKPAGKIAKNIVVTVLKSGREYKAKLVGYDEETDIALLKIEPREDLPVVTLGDSDKVRVGDFAIAIGNPFGLNGTFTFGTISAVNRDFAGNVFSKYIQTDAPINPGNSGGPLVNIFGEVIGINTMIISPTGQLGVAGNVGIGFAIPINTAKRVVDQLIKKGKVERGYIGVSINELDNDTRKQLGIPEDVGVLVSKVEPGSPADKAGIKQGDIIVAVDGEKISNFNDLLSRIASKLPGEKAEIEVIRDGKRIKFVLEVIARPSSEELSRKMEQGGGEGSTAEYKGIIVSEGKRGVIVTGVNDDSPFYGILQKDDEIVEINGQKISNLDDFRKFAEKNRNQKQFLIKFYRGDMFIVRGFTIK
jgi:serine protease Do